MKAARASTSVFAVFVLAVLVCSPVNAFIEGFVPGESGFEGAVTVVSEKEERAFGVVEVKVPYRDVYGAPKEGLARVVVHRGQMRSQSPIPAFCHVHYEKDVGGAKKWCTRGWAVFTAHYTGKDEGYPIDAAVANGNNQARAIIQWVRRLPFIDRTHLHIDGGSQGGYMALAISADMFPVTSTTSDAPVVNWAYNLNYFELNKGPMKYPVKDIADSPLPVVCAVTMLADWCYTYFGNDLSADAWYYVSPISYLDRIANPVLLTCATGDMLVPMEQMTRNGLPPLEMDRFPEGYQRDFDTVTVCEKARVTFEECVPEEDRFIHIEPRQENSYELTLEIFKDPKQKPKEGPANKDKPWSKTHQWSFLYCDEGPPNPYAPHSSYAWAMSPDSFTAHYRRAAPSPDILNAAKLDRLMQRYTLKLKDLPALANGEPVNRLNFGPLEQRDVLAGLLDYAGMGEAHEARLIALYEECPIKPFGAIVSVAGLREALAAAAVRGQGNEEKQAVENHGVFEVSQLRCVIGNNAQMGKHSERYNGVFSITAPGIGESPFVEAYAGLNLEHYFDARPRPQDRDLLFEPRLAPMAFQRINATTAELHQPPTPNYGVESWTRFEVKEPYYIDTHYRCVPTKDVFEGGFIGVFWASYINAPDNKGIYFLTEGASLDDPHWVQFCTQVHGAESSVLHEADQAAVAFEAPGNLLYGRPAHLRYSVPFFYGRFRDRVLIYIFRPGPIIRFAHSPSGGGRTPKGDDTNPAWDFQLIVPDYEVGKEYGLTMRLVYKAWGGRDDVLKEVRGYLELPASP